MIWMSNNKVTFRIGGIPNFPVTYRYSTKYLTLVSKGKEDKQVLKQIKQEPPEPIELLKIPKFFSALMIGFCRRHGRKSLFLFQRS